MTDTDEKHGQKTPAPYVAKSGRTLTPAQARGLKNLLPRPPRPGPGRPKGTSWKGAIIRIGAKKLKEICPDEYALRMATGKPGFGWSRKVIDVAVTEAFRAVILEHNMVAFKILMEKQDGPAAIRLAGPEGEPLEMQIRQQTLNLSMENPEAAELLRKLALLQVPKPPALPAPEVPKP